MIRIRQALTVAGNGYTLHLKEVKTPNARRTLHVGRDVVRALKRRRERQEADRAVLGRLWPGTTLVFTTSLGTPVAPRNLTRSFRRLAVLAGLSVIRLHDLRHPYASLALQRGLLAEVISERLGHARVGFTLDTYRHLYEAERREAALELEDLLGEDAE